MRRMKRWLSIVLCLVMVLGLLPATALAEDTSWANSAVSTLNDIYGNGIFTAGDTAMTVSDARTVLNTMGVSTDKLTGEENDTSTLTRSKACEVLADVFDLPVGENESAIAYLYKQNIINGKSENDLDANGSVSQAEFAVLTYRVLNSVGGGMGSSVEELKPGTDEYFAWMYLAARKCVDFSAEAASGNIDEDTWKSWISQLKGINNSVATDWSVEGSINPAAPEDSTTKLDAAVQIVDAYIKTGGASTIFSDVPTESGFYDGVMYLFDHGIVNGKGDGTFAPTENLYRYELAALLARVDNYQLQDPQNAIQEYKQNAVTKGYMTPPAEGADNWWNGTVTREEAIAGIMKACEVATANVNTAILNRFSDASQISESTKPYLAYAVSIGLISGTSGSALSLTGEVSRGAAGVLLYRTLIGVDATKMRGYPKFCVNLLSGVE